MLFRVSFDTNFKNVKFDTFGILTKKHVYRFIIYPTHVHKNKKKLK